MTILYAIRCDDCGATEAVDTEDRYAADDLMLARGWRVEYLPDATNVLCPTCATARPSWLATVAPATSHAVECPGHGIVMLDARDRHDAAEQVRETSCPACIAEAVAAPGWYTRKARPEYYLLDGGSAA